MVENSLEWLKMVGPSSILWGGEGGGGVAPNGWMWEPSRRSKRTRGGCVLYGSNTNINICTTCSLRGSSFLYSYPVCTRPILVVSGLPPVRNTAWTHIKLVSDPGTMEQWGCGLPHDNKNNPPFCHTPLKLFNVLILIRFGVKFNHVAYIVYWFWLYWFCWHTYEVWSL
jgi:hypothetical protein